MGRGRNGLLTQSHRSAISKKNQRFNKNPRMVRTNNRTRPEEIRVELKPEVINLLESLDPAFLANMLTNNHN